MNHIDNIFWMWKVQWVLKESNYYSPFEVKTIRWKKILVTGLYVLGKKQLDGKNL